jgi:LysR family transcriptional regulator, nitrogen assimilation regulatory protein
MPHSNINTRALQAFIAVYEEQSFSKAAERENATQSGMSTQVKNLELKLGTPLLVRHRKRIDLTPAGQLVYREAQGILRALLATELAVRDMHGAVSGRVRFGMIPSLTRSVLTPALQSFKSQYPTVELSLLEEYSYSLMRRVLDGELDFAIVPSGDLPAGLTATFIGRDREMLISAPTRDTGAAHLSPVPLKALSGARLIVPSALNVRRKYLDSVLSAHGVNIAETLEMDGMLATLEMVAATDWVAILPSAICYPDKSGTQRKLNVLCDPPINLDYVIVEKTEAAPPTAANLLAEQIITQTTVILNDWDDLATG